MNKCSKIYEKEDEICGEESCKFWIDYSEECNCMNVSIKRNGNMTLDQIGLRMGVSHVRIKQIQDRAMKKLEKHMKNSMLDE